MPNQRIFCNSPWYELQIYWDGSLGICCQESSKLYSGDNPEYNIATMSISDWFNSKPVREFRLGMLGDNPLAQCSRCYRDEQLVSNSRRTRSIQKSVIFNQAFDESFAQSPGYRHFMYSQEHQGSVDGLLPIDLHIDLGNFCNLACKMCTPKASSKIAAQEVKWGIESSRPFIGQNWTDNLEVWNRFKQDLIEIPNLNNIHLMGGETLLTDRFEDLVDTLIAANRLDVCWSFVSNGTVFNEPLLHKLTKFKRVGIEISIETVDQHNAYQRQGTDTDLVLSNIDRYISMCNGTSITVTLRPAPSILSIGYMVPLFKYALEKHLLVKSNICYMPEFMNAVHLPQSVKDLYAQKYQVFLKDLDNIIIQEDYNVSDPNNYQEVIKHNAEMVYQILCSPGRLDSVKRLEELTRHCEKWDRVYGYNALELYPEWEFLREFNYAPC